MVRVLLPMAVVGAIVLVAGGAVENFHAPRTCSHAHRRPRRASPAARSPRRRPSRRLGTNGGGFYNANSAHPFENPNPFTNSSRSSCCW